ncbi:PREDICTED: non-canonical poly(A) RNA polymerase PAPD7 isoform X2 [Populus euphratica]|uniref:polynucleotide adenylyltransferase n=1 Tax=Populus euphratica TaxID=75702 RepID=A0AAJ6T611_POPEU|nr:PREDICTED: non-canonical poly(A) RNA polymerase PAPD7 isoform X2 [Populus euphratica]
MESPVQAQAIPLYETLTLTPLSPSPTTTPIRSPLADPLQPYSVFRNEISLSAFNSAAAAESDAPDFFSLDVGGGDEEELELKTPVNGEAKGKWKAEVETENLPKPMTESVWFRGDSKFRSPMLQLHKEIVDFCDFLSPTQEEQASRAEAVRCVFDVIKYIWPNCKVEVFGSFRTGLYLPTSDIDVVILDSGLKSPQIGLNALSRALSQKGIAKKIQVIAKARVPIIKFVEKRSGVSFDISFDVNGGPIAAEFIKNAISKWPELRPLCLILKVFLQQRELNEVYSGGISSYALLAMLMAMLQIHFFDFYGRKLNTTNVGVSCKGTGTFFSKRTKGFMNNGRPFLIAIEDPQAPENDIGKNSFNYFQIRSAFAMAFTTLTNPKTILSLGPNRSILGTIIRPDPVLLERKGGKNGEVTFSSLLPGAGEPLQSNYGQQEILCNWQLDDEEEALPRGGGNAGDGSAHSSGKKRKASSKEKSGKKKLKENGDIGKVRHDESGSKKEKSTKKKPRWRKNDSSKGFTSHAAGSS